MRIGENEAIVRTDNGHPMRLAKSYYDELPRTARGQLGSGEGIRIYNDILSGIQTYMRITSKNCEAP
jgi:hypothetical protein